MDLVHNPIEVLEGTIGNFDALTLIVRAPRLRVFRSHLDLVNDPVNFVGAQGTGPLSGADESVTRGVSRTMCQVSSFISISTST